MHCYRRTGFPRKEKLTLLQPRTPWTTITELAELLDRDTCQRTAEAVATDTGQREIGRQRWSRQIVDAPPADAEGRRLLADGQEVLTVDHRLALSNPALVSAPAKKSFSSVSSPILV